MLFRSERRYRACCRRQDHHRFHWRHCRQRGLRFGYRDPADRPQFKKIDMKKFLIYFMKGVLGEEAARCIVNDKEKK